MAYTNGQGPLGKIYERLRKRAQRDSMKMRGPWWRRVSMNFRDQRIVAYYTGMRDALDAVERELIVQHPADLDAYLDELRTA